ncbi:MAG: ThuA domain-containing protein [Pirellulales bacterium]|nr:ThuA domain-containing protein [Pirellulales bacterium]
MSQQRSGVLVVLAMVAAVALTAASNAVCAEQPAEGSIKLLFMRGGGHDWQGFTPVLVDVLQKTGDFNVTLTENLDDLKAEQINRFDLVLFYGSGRDFTDPKQEAGLGDFVRNGGGLAGVHATDAFKKSDVYWELFGGRFAGHGSGEFMVYVYDKQHPITAGLEDFKINDETYSHDYHKNACMRCLLRMDRGGERQSMAWTTQYGKGRVFNTSLGHGREAWTNPSFQKLVIRGLYWAAGRQPKDP